MAFNPIPDGWRVSMEGSYRDTGHQWALVWGVQDTHTHDIAQATDIGLTFATWFDDHLSDALTDTVQLDRVRITDQESESGVSVDYTTGLPIVGVSSADPVAAQACMIITLLSSSRGRANRGRKYLPGLPASAANAGDGTIWDADQPALYAARVALLATALTEMDNATALAILSESQSICVPVEGVVGRRYMGTQRRRVRSN